MIYLCVALSINLSNLLSPIRCSLRACCMRSVVVEQVVDSHATSQDKKEIIPLATCDALRQDVDTGEEDE